MITPPRIDLHRHLDGNMRLRTILELADRNGILLPATDAEALRPHVTVTEPQPGLVEFLEKFRWPMSVLATLDDCWRIAFENVEDAFAERLDYVELRFSPAFMAAAHGLDPSAVAEAVADGVEAGSATYGVPAALIGILSRNFGLERCWAELEALLRLGDRVDAIDLAGDESGWPAELFADHFRRAREAGRGITIHAGEAAGAESIRVAIEQLGATRIGHGVRAIDDPRLMDDLAARGIGIECCPTSNVQTSTVPSYAEHPLKQFLDRGLLATINTDDPGISGIDFDHELRVAREHCGLTEADVKTCLLNASKIAFRDPFEH